MITIRRTLPAAVALTLVLAACGGSSDADSADAPTATTEAVTDDVAVTTVGDTAPASDPAAGDDTTDSTVPAGTEPASDDPAGEDEAAGGDTTDTEPAAPPAADTTAGEGVSGEVATGVVDVSLVEWEIQAPSEYGAGEITFSAVNNGKFPHEFVVIEGEGYDALPLAEGGAVIEDDLPTGALIGRTGRLGGGSTEDLTVSLAPGNYVLVCNLGGGGNSHAGQGQRLDITVS